jgi:hypothetical protein
LREEITLLLEQWCKQVEHVDSPRIGVGISAAPLHATAWG